VIWFPASRAFGDLVPGESSVRRIGSRRVERSAIWFPASRAFGDLVPGESSVRRFGPVVFGDLVSAISG
jgi:hypothetical protein